jgi:HEAT repeat protein
MKLVLVAFFVSVAAAQSLQPNVVNGSVETRAYSGDLAAQLRASSPVWFGYAVRSAHRVNECSQCCSNGEVQHSREVQLEGTDQIAILFRVEHDQVERLRVTSFNCAMNAGGLPFVWLTGVPAAASLSYLRQLAVRGDHEDLCNNAVFAISEHAGDAATRMLEELAHPPQPPHVRKQALFWIAQRAGERAAAIITGAIENDPDTEVKKQAVFALSQLPRDEGVPKLIDIARRNKNREVQKQAFFWLGQSEDPRALSFFEEILAR